MIVDHLNPIVLKELRQGLKSRSFVATFLGLQVVMVVSMFSFFASVAAGGSDLEFANGLFWFLLGLMLLLFMPLRAFGALYGEIRGNTLEMLFLTRMTSWDIALGKWLALLIQIGLLVCAVLPYLALRYFLGSINITADLIQLGLQVLGSCFLVAVGVGLSAWSVKLLRGLVIFVAIFSLYSLPILLFGFFQSGRIGSLLWSFVDVGTWLVVSILMMIYFVEYGASRIAPPAENHSVRKRGLVLAVCLVTGLNAVFSTQSAVPIAVGLGLLSPVMIDLLCEPVYRIRSLYRPLMKWHALRVLLYPGWPSSLLTVVLLFGGMASLAGVIEGDADPAVFLLVVFNTLLLPFLPIWLIPALARRPLISYLFMQIGNLLFLIFFLVFMSILGIRLDDGIAMLYPPASFVVYLDQGSDAVSMLFQLVPCLLLLSLGFSKAIHPWVEMNRLARESEE